MINKKKLEESISLILDNFIEKSFYKITVSDDSVCLQGTYFEENYEMFISKGFTVSRFVFENKMISLKNESAEIVMFFRMDIEELFKLKNKMKWS